jgi:MFS family permease
MPSLAAEAMRGTGNANAGLGVVLTAFGAGATASPVLAGFVSDSLGFSAGFWALAAVALVGLAFWLLAGRGDDSAAADPAPAPEAEPAGP